MPSVCPATCSCGVSSWGHRRPDQIIGRDAKSTRGASSTSRANVRMARSSASLQGWPQVSRMWCWNSARVENIGPGARHDAMCLSGTVQRYSVDADRQFDPQEVATRWSYHPRSVWKEPVHGVEHAVAL